MRGRVVRFVLPALAAAGLAYALWFSVVVQRREPPVPQQLSMPAESPFPATVSGSGLIEANTRNIGIGSFVSGIVDKVTVVEGERVATGQPLLSLDKRAAEADLAVAERNVASAEAAIGESEALLADQDDQLQRVEKLRPGVVVTEDRLARVRFANRVAHARLVMARSEADVMRARRHAAQVTLERLTVRAPVAGRILKVNVRPGEFVPAGTTDDPLVLLGDDRPLHVRVQIDENDVWRLNPQAPAEAVIRGNRDLRFLLRFVRVEPYVLPKRSLTGDRTERIDTRVLEVIYAFDPGDKPVYIGQQVDVFIDARSHPVPLP